MRSQSAKPGVLSSPGICPMPDVITGLYRIFYDGVLSRLPEPRAVAFGQTLLRTLPIDRIGRFWRDDPRLRTTLGGAPLPNPLIFAARYYDVGILSRFFVLGFGECSSDIIT